MTVEHLEYEIEVEMEDGRCRALVVFEDDCIFRIISAVPLTPQQRVTLHFHNTERTAEVVSVTTSVSGYRCKLHVQDICVH